MAKSLKVDQRVKCINDFLGKGTVLSKVKGLPSYFNILWDKAPPMEYNGKTNPCIANKENLIKIKTKK
jgi:hypothetical protein